MRVYKYLKITETEDDQALITDLLHMKPEWLVLDYEQTLFGNNQWPRREKGCVYDWRGANYRHRTYHTVPAFIHTSGKFFTCYNRLAGRMGFESSAAKARRRLGDAAPANYGAMLDGLLDDLSVASASNYGPPDQVQEPQEAESSEEEPLEVAAAGAPKSIEITEPVEIVAEPPPSDVPFEVPTPPPSYVVETATTPPEWGDALIQMIRDAMPQETATTSLPIAEAPGRDWGDSLLARIRAARQKRRDEFGSLMPMAATPERAAWSDNLIQRIRAINTPAIREDLQAASMSAMRGHEVDDLEAQAADLREHVHKNVQEMQEMVADWSGRNQAMANGGDAISQTQPNDALQQKIARIRENIKELENMRSEWENEIETIQQNHKRRSRLAAVDTITLPPSRGVTQ